MIVTIIILGSQAGTQGSVRGWGVGDRGDPLSLGNEARSISPPSHMHMHTLKLANSKGSKGTEHCDYDRLSMKN